MRFLKIHANEILLCGQVTQTQQPLIRNKTSIKLHKKQHENMRPHHYLIIDFSWEIIRTAVAGITMEVITLQYQFTPYHVKRYKLMSLFCILVFQ